MLIQIDANQIVNIREIKEVIKRDGRIEVTFYGNGNSNWSVHIPDKDGSKWARFEAAANAFQPAAIFKIVEDEKAS